MTAVAERPAPTAVPPEDRPIEDLAAALDAATAGLTELDDDARRTAEGLRHALDDLHRAALVHVIRTLRADERGKELLFALVDEPAVRMVLLAHQLIKPDPTTLARRALEQVRPQLQSHGGDVSLDRVEEGVVYVRLSGACNGCSMSAVTMRNGVEEVLRQVLPGCAVEVLPNEPGPALIPLGEVGLRPGAADPNWRRTGPLDEFPSGRLVRVVLPGQPGEEVPVVVINVDGQLAAYRDSCAHLGLSLADSEVDPATGEITCPWHGHRFDGLSGESRTLPGAQLDPLPLRVEDGHVWVRTRS
ncbi:NifU family protein [Sporichthya brevicatena]|uniref:NifU family protein n=1 Tax=Sporichthya brevicatena TaxID=171442 RepID=A0ABP3RQG5_9ACTN